MVANGNYNGNGYFDSLLQKRHFSRVIRTLISIIDAKDIFTKGHSEKVMKYCARIGKVINLNKKQIMTVKIAALLHDVGKFRIDKSILNKPGQLTEKEWIEIKKHPLVGSKIIEATGLFDEIAKIVKYHHAHYGGGGYPDPGMRGEDIPLGSRIILVADAYDAMRSKRPYRGKRKTRKETIAELQRCSGTQFDPQIVNAFLNFLPSII